MIQKCIWQFKTETYKTVCNCLNQRQAFIIKSLFKLRYSNHQIEASLPISVFFSKMSNLSVISWPEQVTFWWADDRYYISLRIISCLPVCTMSKRWVGFLFSFCSLKQVYI